jgi:hypothetical protein
VSHPKGLRGGTRVKKFADSEEIRDDTVYEVFCSAPFHIIESELLLRHVVVCVRRSPPTFSFHFFPSLLSIWSVRPPVRGKKFHSVCVFVREHAILLDHMRDLTIVRQNYPLLFSTRPRAAPRIHQRATCCRARHTKKL